ncbi:hypothetical protein KBTX_03174 [wastewater metagenome]|uniref:Uncharacterized protein n=2 Tax=unclassified sequences TaxID=12908 RepID=A0A5B8RFP0_9ZZZZ|nr:hypothetical protein KBTEX_03174 [uncultured organism]
MGARQRQGQGRAQAAPVQGEQGAEALPGLRRIDGGEGEEGRRGLAATLAEVAADAAGVVPGGDGVECEVAHPQAQAVGGAYRGRAVGEQPALAAVREPAGEVQLRQFEVHLQRRQGLAQQGFEVLAQALDPGDGVVHHRAAERAFRQGAGGVQQPFQGLRVVAAEALGEQVLAELVGAQAVQVEGLAVRLVHRLALHPRAQAQAQEGLRRVAQEADQPLQRDLAQFRLRFGQGGVDERCGGAVAGVPAAGRAQPVVGVAEHRGLRVAAVAGAEGLQRVFGE